MKTLLNRFSATMTTSVDTQLKWLSQKKRPAPAEGLAVIIE